MTVRILLTNDDGIDAAGLNVLRKALEPMAEVLVAAPSRQRSASGHGITTGQPLMSYPVRYGPLSSGWSIDGTPADCVKIGLALAAERPLDLVIAGINHGANLGQDVFYSGTVSAAIEGALSGIPAIAVSFDGQDDISGLTWTAGLIRWWISSPDFVAPPPGIVYNVNIPALGSVMPGRMVVVRLGRRHYDSNIHHHKDPSGRDYFLINGRARSDRSALDTDVGAHAEGLVTLTPLQLDWSARALMSSMPDWEIPRDFF